MAITQTMTLGRVPLFSGLSSSQIKAMEGAIREKSFPKGDFLFFDGKPCDQIVIVKSGRIKVFRTACSGREQILEVLNPGDTCACNPGSSAWCCSASSQALTDCEVWILPREKYALMVKSNSQMSHALNDFFAKRLQRLSSLIEEVSLDEPKRRIAKFIFDISAPDKDVKGSQKTIELPFTHEEIAHRLGLVRETVTRHLQNLKKARLIDLKPCKVIILDRKGLEALLK